MKTTKLTEKYPLISRVAEAIVQSGDFELLRIFA
jgi:hypothetical protein